MTYLLADILYLVSVSAVDVLVGALVVK
jgi:hypothetical protein